MALAFGSALRLERILLKTRHILGENDPAFKDDNKVEALQYAASLFGLYGGTGAENTYSDADNLTILQSELIASAAAKELILSAISFYKDDVVKADGGPASAEFRQDKLAWLKEMVDMLDKKIDDVGGAIGFGDGTLLPEFFLTKVRACADPVDDTCCPQDSEAFESKLGN